MESPHLSCSHSTYYMSYTATHTYCRATCMPRTATVMLPALTVSRRSPLKIKCHKRSDLLQCDKMSDVRCHITVLALPECMARHWQSCHFVLLVTLAELFHTGMPFHHVRSTMGARRQDGFDNGCYMAEDFPGRSTQRLAYTSTTQRAAPHFCAGLSSEEAADEERAK